MRVAVEAGEANSGRNIRAPATEDSNVCALGKQSEKERRKHCDAEYTSVFLLGV